MATYIKIEGEREGQKWDGVKEGQSEGGNRQRGGDREKER